MRKLKEIHPNGFPSMKTLRGRKTDAMKEWREQKALQKASEKEQRALGIASHNVKAMLDQPVPAHTRNLRRGEVLE